MRDRRHHDAQAGETPLGLTVGSLMSSPAIVVGAQVTAADARHQLEHQSHSSYPVIGHDGRALGLVMTRDLESARHDGYARLVCEMTCTDQRLLVEPWMDAGVLVASGAFQRARHAVVVNHDGRAVGIVSDSDVQDALHAAESGSAELSETGPVS